MDVIFTVGGKGGTCELGLRYRVARDQVDEPTHQFPEGTEAAKQ